MKPIEMKTSDPSNKKVIGFLLQAEVNRNKEKPKNNSEEIIERPLTTTCTDNSLMTEQNNTHEKLWTPTSNGFSDSNYQNDQLWIPEAFDNGGSYEMETSKPKEVSSLTYKEWLERKRNSLRDGRKERPLSASENQRSKVGRELDAESFQKWLEGKKKLRKHSKSEIIESHRASSGVPFEEWLRQKRQQLNGKFHKIYCSKINTH